jgi:CRISPR-associated exonuclease Cas4
VVRAYRNAAGALVLVELKTRKRHQTYPSDVIELSAQRVALAAQTGELVVSHAYVLTVRVDDHSEKYHRVSLMTVAAVIALATRREELLVGNVVPRPACFSAGCWCVRCKYSSSGSACFRD